MGHTHHLIKFRKNILITFIHNLVTFFECFQRLLATFLSSVKQKNIVKDHMCSGGGSHTLFNEYFIIFKFLINFNQIKEDIFESVLITLLLYL